MQMMQEMQEKMLDPTKRGPKTKKGTGKRLTPKERKKMQKQRAKMMRQRKRQQREK